MIQKEKRIKHLHYMGYTVPQIAMATNTSPTMVMHVIASEISKRDKAALNEMAANRHIALLRKIKK